MEADLPNQMVNKFDGCIYLKGYPRGVHVDPWQMQALNVALDLAWAYNQAIDPYHTVPFSHSHDVFD